MVLINHELKAIFIHIPKNGGSYISQILMMNYGFIEVRVIRKDYEDFSEFLDSNIEKLDDFVCNYPNSTLHKKFFKKYSDYNIRNKGIIRYYKPNDKKKIVYLRKSIKDKNLTITDEMWKTYYKFVFIRNPYDRIISSWKFSSTKITYMISKKISKISLLDFLNNKDLLDNASYSHSFITQKAQILEEDNTIQIDYFGNFHNLNEELINILTHLGITKFTHINLIHNNVITNKSNHLDFFTYYDENILKKVNELFEEDFIFFNFTKFENIEDFKNFKFENLQKINNQKIIKTLEEKGTIIKIKYNDTIKNKIKKDISELRKKYGRNKDLIQVLKYYNPMYNHQCNHQHHNHQCNHQQIPKK